jgi:AraC-like DNA-binding protein
MYSDYYVYIDALIKLNSVGFLGIGILGLVSGSFFENRKTLYLRIGLYVSFSLMGILSDATHLSNVNTLQWIYPSVSPVIFLFGPCLYLYFSSHKVRPITMLFHFLPFILFTIATLYYHYSGADIGDYWNHLLRREVHLMDYPIQHFSGFPVQPIAGLISITTYSLLHLKSNRGIPFRSAAIGMLLSIIVYNMMFYGWLERSAVTLFIHFGVNLICLIPSFAFVAFHKPIVEEITRINAGEKLYDQIKIDTRVEAYMANHGPSETFFLKDSINIESLVKDSNIESNVWGAYFLKIDTSLLELKRSIRIRVARRLIDEGYLQHHSIDGLAEHIGYRSRTSFYSAWLNVEGESFTVFKKRMG